MRYLTPVLLLLAACSATVELQDDSADPSSADRLEPAPASLERQLIRQLVPDSGLDSFERFELLRIPGDAEVYAAICDWEVRWWGTACVFEVKDGRIVSLQNLEPTEQSMYSIRCITLKQVPEPLLEAYGMTHMGHGSYYLYRITGNHAELLIDTAAVDRHHDRDILSGGMLRPMYHDVNGNGYTDVTLIGIRKFNENDALDRTGDWEHWEIIRKVFLYDPNARIFREDLQMRLGSRYHY
jgi:hypothetical protein